uniref:Uncharacterized protein n=1 Tax=Triticum urartu TaxID=4572 RepID=A0A8R7TEB0_TRIUA
SPSPRCLAVFINSGSSGHHTTASLHSTYLSRPPCSHHLPWLSVGRFEREKEEEERWRTRGRPTASTSSSPSSCRRSASSSSSPAGSSSGSACCSPSSATSPASSTPSGSSPSRTAGGAPLPLPLGDPWRTCSVSGTSRLSEMRATVHGAACLHVCVHAVVHLCVLSVLDD